MRNAPTFREKFLRIEKNSLVHLSIVQLLALTTSSNAELYKLTTGLGIIKEGQLELKSFHYHVRKLDLRKDNLDHLKRKNMPSGDRPPSLAGCRLFSSPRLTFSVRLIPFAYESEPEEEERISFGVLGVVQELCSGMLRAEVLCSGYASHEDLYDLKAKHVAAFVASAISLPKLKIASIHFPKLRFQPHGKVGPRGLIAGWLGYEQNPGRERELQREFSEFCEICIKATRWEGEAYRLQPEVNAFCLDFPEQSKSDILDLTRPCGKPWRLRTVAKELNQRIDRWNVGLRAGEINPVLRIWIARQCFNRVWTVDEQRQKAALLSLCKSVLYRKRSDPSDLEQLQNFGMEHLSCNRYAIYR
ncbi:hypothetical protein ABC383_17690 [Noviherbaspirillum sp. 1P10PC]|uniref:hypothetical protein n=1 Tax=Noviherbaspirillum sp. 1P10PC TaxID=3132292 RepID=UPI0039A135D5